MPDFFLDPNLAPFHLSVVALVVLSAIESLGIYFGIRPSSALGRLLPHWLVHAPCFQVKFSKILVFVFLLINFSFAGYFLQLAYFAKENSFAPAIYLVFPAFIIAIFFTVFMIHCLDQVIKPQHSMHHSNLIGRLATISSGNARPGFSAQARIRDEYGQVHYIQVEPEFGELEFQSQIILIRFTQAHYIAKKISASNHLFNQQS